MEEQASRPFLLSFKLRYEDTGKKSCYGSADETKVEMRILREMYLQEMRGWLGPKIEFRQLTSGQRKVVKHLVALRIIKDGWALPTFSNSKERGEAVAESAVHHACVVAEELVLERGEFGADELHWSYITKNQFDRFVYMVLIRGGWFWERTKMWKQWFSTQDREKGYENSKVKYPVTIDDSKIYGIAKPHRYWPAQLLRKIEELRLGRMSQKEQDELLVGETDVRTYTIPWIDFEETILNARSVDDIAVGIALKSMEIMKSNGLSNEQIVRIIIAGYSPRGPLLEHGNIYEVHHLWSRILHNVRRSDDDVIKEIAPMLQALVEKRFQEAGFEFNFERMVMKRVFVRFAGVIGSKHLV